MITARPRGPTGSPLPRRPVLALVGLVVAAIAWFAFGAAPVAAAPSIQAELEAEVDVRSAITFRLDAPWTAPPPSRVSILFGLPDAPVTRRGRAAFELDDGRLTASHRWRPRGTLLPGAEIEYRFEVHGADATARTTSSTVTYIDVQLPWRTQSEGLVEFWWYAGDDGLATDAVSGIRRGLAALDEDFGLELQRRTRLVFYADGDRMRADMGRGTRAWVGGVAAARFNLIVLYASEFEWGRSTLAATIAHELTHIAIEHAIGEPPRAIPTWLHEGLATVVESAVAERFSYEDIVNAAFEANRLISLRGLTGSFPVQSSGALLAYAQSNSFVKFIINRWGESAITDILHAYRDGASQDSALRQAIGLSLNSLEAEWLATLDQSDAAPAPSAAGLTAAAAVALPLTQP
ncbi:MAG: peptidase MA family metallohydrolase [Chloroflexi bacterium]|nr:peptidase MA family metallohydrolase [Chloroflexota bacterium]